MEFIKPSLGISSRRRGHFDLTSRNKNHNYEQRTFTFKPTLHLHFKLSHIPRTKDQLRFHLYTRTTTTINELLISHYYSLPTFNYLKFLHNKAEEKHKHTYTHANI